MTDIPPRLFERFPDAFSVRGPERCPHCKRDTEYSFLLAPHIPIWERGATEEPCGYACVVCKWSNAGWREVKGEGV